MKNQILQIYLVTLHNCEVKYMHILFCGFCFILVVKTFAGINDELFPVLEIY